MSPEETRRLFHPEPGDIDRDAALRGITYHLSPPDSEVASILLRIANDDLTLDDDDLREVLRKVPDARESMRRLSAAHWLVRDVHGRRLAPWTAPETT